MFDHVIKDWDASGDTDEQFLQDVKKAFAILDNGVIVGSWGQIQGELLFLCISLRIADLLTLTTV